MILAAVHTGNAEIMESVLGINLGIKILLTFHRTKRLEK